MVDRANRAIPVDGAMRRRRAATAAFAAIVTLAMAAVALGALPTVTTDGRPIVLAATVTGTAAGLGAAWLILVGRIRVAGMLLVLAIITPTFFAYILNLVPLLLGIVLIVDSFRADGAWGPRGRAGLGSGRRDRATGLAT